MAENIIIDKVIGESGASNSNAIDQIQTIESKLSKGKKKRSHAWDYFTRKTNFDGTEKVVCNYCKKEYFADTKEQIWGKNGDVVVVPWKFDQEECTKALCRMVIINELPFRFVEKEGFKQFMKVEQSCFHIPSRTTVTQDCFDLFDDEKRKLMVVFKHNKGCL
uniref:BED-type domain-containing protein n=1 Tax=Solanum lycopersicum TaxID=4081 RepID=A0A3Q7FL63_SOLLC